MTASSLRAHLSHVLLCAALACVCNSQADGQTVRTTAQARAVAMAFAPVFYQGLGDGPRRNDMTRARVVYVETLAHNRFLKYMPEGTTTEGVTADTISLEDGHHPRLYVEPKGHGIEVYQAGEKRPHKLLRYSYGGRADAPTANAEAASYELLSLQTDLWSRAHKGVNETYGATSDYGRVTVSVAQAKGRAQERQV